ncbi:MAG: hypothetical protein HY515_03790 [Candidatus Aenigmarchaeota archaeon]|nr:hypothetical protein [Candidatus Aenigmarchaeota archaeon]
MTFLAKSSTKKRKGVSLPIDMLVILAIAVIILIAIVAVFMGVWSPFATNQQSRAEFNKQCQVLVNTGCNGDPSSTLCAAAKGIVLDASDATPCGDATEKLQVKVGCGCPGVASGSETTTTTTTTTTTVAVSGAKKANGAACTSGDECTSGKCPIPGVPSPGEAASPRVCVA